MGVLLIGIMTASPLFPTGDSPAYASDNDVTTESATAETLSEYLDSYLASGLSSALRTDAAATFTDPDEFQTFYWPWCRDASGIKTLDDPANLYGCQATSCSCTGYETPVDLRDDLDNTLGTVSVNNDHFEVNGTERRYFGVVYMNDGPNFPDMDDAASAWNAEMLAKRLAVTGHNLIRSHHIDNSDFLGGTLDTIDPASLDDFVRNVEMLGREGIAVDVNLHTKRGDSQDYVETSPSASSSTDGDGVLSAEELRCEATSSDYHQSKALVYVSDDLRAVEMKFAKDLLEATSSTTGTSLADNPAVALFEITNENPLPTAYAAGYVHGVSGSACESADEHYFTQYWADELERDFQDWLSEVYQGDFTSLQTAWEPAAGSDLLSGHNGDFDESNPDQSGLDTYNATNSWALRRVFWDWDFALSDVTSGGSTLIDASFSAEGQCLSGASTCTGDRYVKLTLNQAPSSGTVLADSHDDDSFILKFRGPAYVPSGSEPDQHCSDGEDDDGDGLVDEDDPDCNGQSAFRVERACLNGSDDDADGVTDANDPDCQGGNCSDGDDDDGDGAVDTADAQCAAGNPWETSNNSQNDNVDIDFYNVSESVVMAEDSPYTISFSYRVESYEDQNGVTSSSGTPSCAPSLSFYYSDSESYENVSSETFALDASSGWHDFTACLAPDGDFDPVTVGFRLGNDCAQVVVDIDEVRVLEQGLGLADEETGFGTVALKPYDERFCMSQTRWNDTVNFFTAREEDYYRNLRQHLRDYGFDGPVENANCSYNLPDYAARDLTLDSSAYAGTDAIFTDSHAYWDYGRSTDTDGDGTDDAYCYHALSYTQAYDDADRLKNESDETAAYSSSTRWGNPIVAASHAALDGMPFLVSEYSTNIGNPYREEGLLFMAIQSSFQGWDGLTWVNYNHWTDASLNSALNQYKMDALQYNLENPLLAALMPAAALILRNDYARTTAESIDLHYSADEIAGHFAGEYGISDSTVEGLPAAIALTHPVRRDVGGADPLDLTSDSDAIAEFEGQADDTSLTVSSNDGVVSWDFNRHHFTLNAGKAQGFAGFIQGQTLSSGALAAYLENPDYGIVMATSLDDRTIEESETILVTTTAYAKNDGQYDLVQNVNGEVCYPSASHLGPGDTYDESAGEGYSQTLFPQGVIALDLGTTASAVSVTAVDAIGRTAPVSVTASSDQGRYLFEFNRDAYDFSSATFGSNGTVEKTLWFKVAVTRSADADGDGTASDTDCDDANSAVYPGVAESCNDVDDDCDGSADEGLTILPYYRDTDEDSYGSSTDSVTDCSAPTGYVATNGDCRDDLNKVHPGAAEICDNRDQNCDGSVDEGLPTYAYYRDADGDSYGDPGNVLTICRLIPPAGYVRNGTDCDDTDRRINPSIPEIADRRDNNCDPSDDK
jgi:hypothetical protein